MTDTRPAWALKSQPDGTFKAELVTMEDVDQKIDPICTMLPDPVSGEVKAVFIWTLNGDDSGERVRQMLQEHSGKTVTSVSIAYTQVTVIDTEWQEWGALLDRNQYPFQASFYPGVWDMVVRGGRAFDFGGDVAFWTEDGMRHINHPYATLLVQRTAKADHD